MKRAALWVLVVVLDAAGGAFLRTSLEGGNDAGFIFFFGLLMVLPALAIYWHVLRLPSP